MMLTTKGRYAVMAMVDLVHYGNNGKATALHEIAERQNITINYLEQLFNKLKKKQLVDSIKGPGGGYNLKINAKDITILDIILAAGESLKITRCDAANKGCLGSNHKVCLTHVLWEGLGLQISNYLKSISLQDVCDNVSIVDGKK